MIYELATPGLHGIELSGNPWSCDCRLRALKEWIVTANVPHTIEPTCASPPRLENKQFAELAVEEFACPPDLLSAPRFVEANAGKARSYDIIEMTKLRPFNSFLHSASLSHQYTP